MLWCKFVVGGFGISVFSFVPKEMIPLSTKKHIDCPTPKMSDFLSERKLESG